MKDTGQSRWEKIERVGFIVIGLMFLAACFRSVWAADHTGAAALFGMAFFSFFYSRLSQFKRFKGLGFEAELWEDKKKEAEGLIERLKSVVEIYTREIVLTKVMQGRWSDGADWASHWELFDGLVAKHSDLGQEIDFSELKGRLDEIFLSDAIAISYSSIAGPVSVGRGEAFAKLDKEFPQPIKDVKGYRARLAVYNSIPENLGRTYELIKTENAAATVLARGLNAQKLLLDEFKVEIEFDETAISRLELLSNLYEERPLKITPDLIALTVREKD